MTAMVDLSAWPEDVQNLSEAFDTRPEFALVLGSGLDDVADALTERVEIPYSDIIGMKADRLVPGQAGVLTLGRSGARSVLCFRGRLHRYQGFSAHEVTYPIRLAAELGVKTLVVTNAAGSVRDRLRPGSLMAITDQINLTADSPLIGWPGPEGGSPFVPMAGAYDAGLLEVARTTAERIGVELVEGVYAGLTGPAYETPAEVGYLRSVGADAVGMSTVFEVIVARALGIRTLGISSITNVAGESALTHQAVVENGARAAHDLGALLSAILAVL